MGDCAGSLKRSPASSATRWRRGISAGALRTCYEGVIAAGVSSAEMRIRQVEALGDSVGEVGEVGETLAPPEGEPFEDVAKYLVVCRRDGEGRLRFWLDMFHSDTAAGGG